MPHSLNQSTNFSGEGRTGTLLLARGQEWLACPLTHQEVQLLLATTANGRFGYGPDVHWRSDDDLAVTVTPCCCTSRALGTNLAPSTSTPTRATWCSWTTKAWPGCGPLC